MSAKEVGGFTFHFDPPPPPPLPNLVQLACQQAALPVLQHTSEMHLLNEDGFHAAASRVPPSATPAIVLSSFITSSSQPQPSVSSYSVPVGTNLEDKDGYWFSDAPISPSPAPANPKSLSVIAVTEEAQQAPSFPGPKPIQKSNPGGRRRERNRLSAIQCRARKAAEFRKYKEYYLLNERLKAQRASHKPLGTGTSEGDDVGDELLNIDGAPALEDLSSSSEPTLSLSHSSHDESLGADVSATQREMSKGKKRKQEAEVQREMANPSKAQLREELRHSQKRARELSEKVKQLAGQNASLEQKNAELEERVKELSGLILKGNMGEGLQF